MEYGTWIREFPGAVTVCDGQGIIVEMNNAAAASFETEEGYRLVGTNVLDCHPAHAREKLEHLLKSHQKNIYTIEKKGKKKLIYQSPWFVNGTYAGIVELSLELPADIPHFVRT